MERSDEQIIVLGHTRSITEPGCLWSCTCASAISRSSGLVHFASGVYSRCSCLDCIVSASTGEPQLNGTDPEVRTTPAQRRMN